MSGGPRPWFVPQCCKQTMVLISGDWKLQQKARAATERQDRYLRNLALRNRQITARGLHNDLQLETGVHVSNQTV